MLFKFMFSFYKDVTAYDYSPIIIGSDVKKERNVLIPIK